MTTKALLGTAAIAASVFSACNYDPHYGDCAISCSAVSGCPSGLTCGSDGLCRTAGTSPCAPNDAAWDDGTGGMITHVNGQTVHTFSAGTSGSTFVPPLGLSSAALLVVAGGGGGGATRGGGGGGAGGLMYQATYAISKASFTVTVGYGGPPATNGEDSSFDTITAIGGGAGRPSGVPNGGCGGGASHDTNNGPAGTGTVGQGSAGGSAGYNNGSNVFTGAGGGGAGNSGAVGAAGAAGAGGPGLSSTISGTLIYYAGGGGGGAQNLGSGALAAGLGGNGGGGNGGVNAVGTDGVDGTGGGGGGGGGCNVADTCDPNFNAGGRGGNGIVILSYPTQR